MRTIFLVFLFSLCSLNAYAQQKGAGNRLPTNLTTAEPPSAKPQAPPTYEKLPEGLRLGDEDRLEVYVDVEGRIYQRRTYQGVVPRMNDDAAFSERVQNHIQTQKGTKILWVGFQQMLAASRVFIQTDRIVKYSLYKPTPNKIVVEFPRAKVPLRNNQRELVTTNFQTPVEIVRVVEDKKSGTSKIVINLKRPVGYIYRQDGPYVFVDIER